MRRVSRRKIYFIEWHFSPLFFQYLLPLKYILSILNLHKHNKRKGKRSHTPAIIVINFLPGYKTLGLFRISIKVVKSCIPIIFFHIWFISNGVKYIFFFKINERALGIKLNSQQEQNCWKSLFWSIQSICKETSQPYTHQVWTMSYNELWYDREHILMKDINASRSLYHRICFIVIFIWV